MGLLAKDKAGTDYEPLAAGMYHAVCYGIIDLGTQPGGQFEPKRKVAFLWEVPSERMKFERDGVQKDLPRGLSGIYTLSLSSKGLLRPMLESWRGKAFTDEELKGFDVKTILGANCFLNVVHKEGTGKNAGKTYANVKSVNPLPKGTARVKSENPQVFFSLDDCGDTITVPESIPDWLKAKIMQSEECMKEQRASGHVEPTEEEAANQTGSIEEDVPF
jgi:hypothetical protein